MSTTASDEATGPLRPRRSVLYMPGANERALEKAQTLPADALILDLEDAVAPDAKEEARTRVCDAVRSGAYGHRELAIRANGLDTHWGPDDIRAAAAAGPDAVLVPKVSSPGDIATIEALLAEGGAPAHTSIWAMLETPDGILDAAAICGASVRLEVLVMGTNDITKELHATHVPGRQPLLYALGHCLVAARAAGKVILDGVYNDIKDPEGFAAECTQGAQMGFDGKTLIHPSQLEDCNRIFSPSPEEVDHARRVIEAWDAATAEGKGVVTVDGRMIENLHVDNARRVLAVADAIAAHGTSD
jgi:citrate lyase subunit beta/citryl-CoA lyase